MTIRITHLTGLPAYGFTVEDRVIKFNVQISNPTDSGVAAINLPASIYVRNDEAYLLRQAAGVPPQSYTRLAIVGDLYLKKEGLAQAQMGLHQALAIRADQILFMGAWEGGSASPLVTVTAPSRKIEIATFNGRNGETRIFKSSSNADYIKNGDQGENLWIDWSVFEGSPGSKKMESLMTKADPTVVSVTGYLEINRFTTQRGDVVEKLRLTNLSSFSPAITYIPKQEGMNQTRTPPQAPPQPAWGYNQPQMPPIPQMPNPQSGWGLPPVTPQQPQVPAPQAPSGWGQPPMVSQQPQYQQPPQGTYDAPPMAPPQPLPVLGGQEVHPPAHIDPNDIPF